jgi:catechol 2,3-dioxygenase-like lactoylglutathione lyase family enzyme
VPWKKHWVCLWQRRRQTRRDEVGFKVADVDVAFSDLIAGGALPLVPPTNRLWGQRTAYVRDPDGHLVELAQDLRQP